jgi:hypothetical protein
LKVTYCGVRDVDADLQEVIDPIVLSEKFYVKLLLVISRASLKIKKTAA